MRLLKWAFGIAAFIVIFAYVGVVGWLYNEQRTLVFRPDPTPHTASSVGLVGFRDVDIQTADGQRLVGLYKPPQADQPVVLYFHGNTGRIPPRVNRMKMLTSQGAGLLFVSYRGYSGSSGAPSEVGLAEDARASFDWLKREASRKIIVYGESLGTGVAVKLATERNLSGIILDAPYTSLVDVARKTYWWVPVSILLKDQFRSIERIASIGGPLLIMHGDADRIVPFEFGEQLYAAGIAPKRFIRNAGGTHSNNLERSTDDVLAFISAVAALD